jgi:hypothetical protein
MDCNIATNQRRIPVIRSSVQAHAEGFDIQSRRSSRNSDRDNARKRQPSHGRNITQASVYRLAADSIPIHRVSIDMESVNNLIDADQ